MISVIGAGPVGCYAAWKLAKEGHDVRVFDKKQQIGMPVQCTGILTKQIYKALDVEEDCILNRIKIARLHSPNGNHIDIRMKNSNLIIDRTLFDKSMASLAESAGAKILMKHKLEALDDSHARINGNNIKSEWVIGADGPRSKVARCSGLYGDRRLLVGNQVRARMKADNVERMDIYLGQGCFSWSVPESENVSRLGIVDYKDSSNALKRMVREKGAKVIEHQGGLIPLYKPNQRFGKGNVLLVGDAATQVKPTTFGGIVPGFLAAQQIGKLENYEKAANEKIRNDLLIGLKMRNVMDKFDSNDYNELAKIFGSGKPKEIIEKHDRDFPSRFMLKLLVAKPSLLKFAWKALWGHCLKSE